MNNNNNIFVSRYNNFVNAVKKATGVRCPRIQNGDPIDSVIKEWIALLYY